MKLYLLKRPTDTVHYNENIGFVVRADNELEAREIAARLHVDEEPEIWWQKEHSDCVELKQEGAEGLILRSFKG